MKKAIIFVSSLLLLSSYAYGKNHKQLKDEPIVELNEFNQFIKVPLVFGKKEKLQELRGLAADLADWGARRAAALRLVNETNIRNKLQPIKVSDNSKEVQAFIQARYAFDKAVNDQKPKKESLNNELKLLNDPYQKVLKAIEKLKGPTQDLPTAISVGALKAFATKQ